MCQNLIYDFQKDTFMKGAFVFSIFLQYSQNTDIYRTILLPVGKKDTAPSTAIEINIPW